MFCEKCGANVPDNTKFCPNCGNKIINVPIKKHAGGASTIDSFKTTWDSWSGGKKIIALIVACCIGLLLIGSIMSIISPDANTSSSSDSYNYENSDSDVSEVSDSSSSESYSSSSSDSDYSYSSSSNGHDVHTHYEGEEGTDDTYGTVYDDGSVESHSSGHTKYGDYQMDSYMDSDGNIHGTANIGGHTYTI